MKPPQRSIMFAWSVMLLLNFSAGDNTMQGQDVQAQQGNVTSDVVCGALTPSASSPSVLEGFQIETSDLGLYERFFLNVLHADEVQRMDHPQVDSIRGYCYRNVLIVVRQDIKTPRPTGWVQLNFAVADVNDVQQQFEHALRESDLESLGDMEGRKIVRLRLKRDVARNTCRVDRLEVTGPEGFMIGFDQVKEDSCKTAHDRPEKDNKKHNRPHH